MMNLNDLAWIQQLRGNIARSLGGGNRRIS
jgi:hypothetical protein